MAFRQLANRHDAWINYREESAQTLAEIDLPAAVFESEQTLVEFLTIGHRNDLGIDLDVLSDPQFWKLFRFVDSWFDCNAEAFTALERRRLGGRRAAPQ